MSFWKNRVTKAALRDQIAALAKQVTDLRTELVARLDRIERGETTIMADLNTLQADVTAEQTVEQSAIKLLGGLKTQLDAAIAANANGDPTKLADLSSQIEANTAALAAAVTANTPAAPAA